MKNFTAVNPKINSLSYQSRDEYHKDKIKNLINDFLGCVPDKYAYEDVHKNIHL